VVGRRILVVNGGSSSLKSAVYDVAGDTARVRVTVGIERIGLPRGSWTVTGAGGERLETREVSCSDLRAATTFWLEWLRAHGEAQAIHAVGHRIVHGGEAGDRPRPLDAALLGALRRLAPLDPDHLPGEIAAIEVISQSLPGCPQVACFDTAFHWRMPDRARQLPLPRRLRDRGFIRYGFHGLSYEYLMHALRAQVGERAGGRVILAHLGSGASLAAVHHGLSLDTTMGMTPTGGVMMGTRSGDLDPGVLLRLIETEGLDAPGLRRIVKHESGLRGVSGVSSDMQELLARRATEPAADEAVTMFCYLARKALGAMLAAIGGADIVVFSGGIGTHAPAVRAEICEGLAFAGVTIDAAANASGAAVISAPGAPVDVRVIATNEEVIIARHTETAMRNEE
jgi:acetate kinase